MKRIALCLLALGACNLDSELNDGGDGFTIGGTLRGLWTGADETLLTLQSDGRQTIASVLDNGTFTFDLSVPDGASYAISVAAPAEHQCAVVAGGDGTIAGADVTTVEVACTGPDVTVDLSLPIAFTFDPTLAAQPVIPISVLAQSVSVTVGGDITSVSVDGATVAPGVASAPRALALGVNEVAIDVAAGSLSKTFTLACDRGAGVLEQTVYGKASNTGGEDRFGTSVSVFGDLIAVGAPSEGSNATGIDGNQNDNSLQKAGAVYVFRRTGATWAQEAYIKASNTNADDIFGTSVSLHGDRLAVGAPFKEDASAQVGAVYVFRRIAGVWTEEQILKAPVPGPGDIFGTAVSLFGDRLAIGASQEDSGTDGVGTTPDESAPNAGAAYVFRRQGTVWVFEAYLKAANSGASDQFGHTLALSGPDGGSGDTLAVGAPTEDSNVVGVQNGAGASTDDSASDSGAAYVFKRINTTWTQQAFIKSPSPNVDDTFGCAVAISMDTLAVGACAENDGGLDNAGAVHTHVRTGNSWSFESTLRASNRAAFDNFGQSVSLLGDVLAVGAPFEDGGLPGINQNGTDNSAPDSGAVYLFRRTAPAAWSEEAYMKTLDPANVDRAADTLGLAISGDTIVVGAQEEDSNATGINNGNALDTSANNAGAFYIFR